MKRKSKFQRDESYRFYIKTEYFQDGKRQTEEGNVDSFVVLQNEIKGRLIRLKDWIYINVFYQYKDASGHRYGQITSFTNRCRPSGDNPTIQDVSRFVQMMERVNKSGLRASDRRAVIRYCKDVLKVNPTAVGLGTKAAAGNYGGDNGPAPHGLYNPQR